MNNLQGRGSGICQLRGVCALYIVGALSEFEACALGQVASVAVPGLATPFVVIDQRKSHRVQSDSHRLCKVKFLSGCLHVLRENLD